MLTAAPRATGEHVPGTFDSALQHFPSASMEHATMSGSTAVTRLNIVNLLAYVLNVAITWGSQLGWFGATNQEQSLKYQTLVTPIGFAFSIWGPIFLLQALFAVVQFTPNYRGDESVVSGVGYWYVAVCAAQAGWTICFAQDVVWLSMVFMLLILACLSALCNSVVRVDEPASAETTWSVTWRYLCFRAPFLMHLGWITAASFVNFNACLVKYAAADTDLHLAAAIATIALLLLPGLVNPATTTLSGSADPLYSLVIVWAFFGVHKELLQPELQGDLKTWVPALVQHALAGVAALMAGGLLVVVLARLAWRVAAASRLGRSGAGSDTTAPVYPRFEERSDNKPVANCL